MTFAHVAPARSSSAAMGRRRKRRTELLHRESLDNCHICGRFNFLTIRVLWPEFQELSSALTAYLAEITKTLIREEVYGEMREAEEIGGNDNRDAHEIFE
jgi:hypothetical protein